MKQLSSALEKEGFIVVNENYPSTKHNIEYLADICISTALSQCPRDATVHFVTHSMGAIILRQYLSRHKIANLGRVVMLGPPNKGSQVVDRLSKMPGFKFLNGPSGMQLGTEKTSLPNSLGPAEFELGVIAGTRTINLFLSLIIPGEDDGKVSVENTKLEGMSSHLVLPVTHTFMMQNKKVIREVVHFIKEGSFIKSVGK